METLAGKTADRFGKTIRFGLLLSSWLLLAGCSKPDAVPYYHTPDFTPIWTQDQNRIDTLHTVLPFRFTDQFGNAFTQEDVENSVYLTNFFFTACPSVCPKMMETVRLVYNQYRGNPAVKFLSHSVTPERDSVSVLKKYADRKGIDGQQWHLLTGKRKSINAIARLSYFIEKEQGFLKDSAQFLHTENLILVDQRGHIRGLYNGTLAVEADRIIHDIDILLQEQNR
ncbi:SCO family protein [Larkinella terrae]|uniref:SCO family protein n=1 Tax=Larkinella terrae TaxID=2025311 RepID=A0A7K0EPU1_9BACT|nr:SCO family protein [Larkinella terrae]MRS63581.1 SCO family protein [Larkinella terrae]